jgi:hypothetical protein
MGNPINRLHPDNLSLSAFSIPLIAKRTNSFIIKSVILYFVLLLASSDLAAQPFDLPSQHSDQSASLRLPAYFELGQNTVSEGLFLKTALIPTCEFGKYSVQSGYRFDIISNNESILSGFDFTASRSFKPADFPLDIQGLFILTRYSDVLYETNWGVLLKTRYKHFKISAGTSFRTLALNKSVIEDLGNPETTKIHENWNMIYHFIYYIKPLDNNWNINFSITNLDYFNINQETNPVFKIGALYDVSQPVTLFIDAGFESSGVFNAHPDYFGFYIKTGIIWNIWKKAL